MDTMNDDVQPPKWCPSGSASAPESVVLGVRSGESSQVSYLASPVPAADVVPLIPTDIEPTRILRFASHCVSNCVHRADNDCTLINRVMKLPAPPRITAVPRCHLRPECKWWSQIGVGACSRCPAVATAVTSDDLTGALVANPETTLDQLEAWIAELSAFPATGVAEEEQPSLPV